MEASKLVGFIIQPLSLSPLEVVNEKNIRKYLDYLVNDNGWTKSGGLIPTYTSPCGKKGCYADWERRIYAEYNKKKLSSTEITAFFEQFQ